MPSLSLVDIGCRDGPPAWVARWPGRLVGVGVDPDAAHVAWLASTQRWPGLRFEAAWIGADDFEASLPGGVTRAQWRARNNDTWRRTCSAVAQATLAEPVPPGDPGQQPASPPMRSLDDTARALPVVDLLKVDTDGHDLEVLLSGPQTLARALGVAVEVQFQGPAHPKANHFANIDGLLRAAGFELFDLQPHRHARAALPAPFWGGGGSPTHRGQSVWAEALYLRDVARDPWPGLGERGWALAALMTLAGLPDCALELVDAGLLPGASAADAAALGRVWWRAGGGFARHWIRVDPAKILFPGNPRRRDRLRRAYARWLWRG